jgi:hypothetical protein
MAKGWAFIPNVGHETSAVIGWNSVVYIPAHVPTSTLQAKGSFHGSVLGQTRYLLLSKQAAGIYNMYFRWTFAPEHNYVPSLDAMAVSGSRGPEADDVRVAGMVGGSRI